MKELFTAIGERIIDDARYRGVEAEAFFLHDRGLSIEIADAKLETLKEAEEIGLGLRVINKGRLGFAYSSDLSDLAIQELLDNAISISAFTVADEHNVLPARVSEYPRIELFDEEISASSMERKIEIAREMESAAQNTDNRISIIERAGYEESEFTVHIMNTNGLYASARANLSSIYLFLVAEENGDAQNGFSVMSKKRIQDLQPDAVAREAAHNALRSLHASTIASGLMPCIMEPYVFSRFLAIIARMLDAEAVQKGKSMFAGREGESVGTECFSLVDDGTFADGVASFPFDGEGVNTRRNILVDKGVLKTFLYDSYTAKKAGRLSSGNGQRSSFRSLPSVGSSNFIIQPGKSSPEQLIADIDRGFYITGVMGMHTANPISGDFSIGANGILIQKGKLDKAVRGVTIAGNIAELLRDIEAVGNDLRFFGSKASPSIRLKALSVGGD